MQLPFLSLNPLALQLGACGMVRVPCWHGAAPRWVPGRLRYDQGESGDACYACAMLPARAVSMGVAGGCSTSMQHNWSWVQLQSCVYSVPAALALLQGLLAVDPSSGAVQLLATRLSNASLARPRADIRFCDDIDVSRKSGKIYFSGERAASSAVMQGALGRQFCVR